MISSQKTDENPTANERLKAKTQALKDKFESRKFLTCAGTETYLFFQQGYKYPEMCAFCVFENPDEIEKLEKNHLSKVLLAAAKSGHGLLIDTQLWRAQPDYLKLLGRDCGPEQLLEVHETAIGRTKSFVDTWRNENGYDADSFPVLIVADIGPRGDGYKVEDPGATSDVFREYHSKQLQAIKQVGGVDLVCAYTITSVEESIGIVQASTDAGFPVVISPTVETDGRLPDGNFLGEMIEKTDHGTEAAPLFYMVNCAHPYHLRPILERAAKDGENWVNRFRGFRANASCKSHEELDNSPELDRGDIDELAKNLVEMRKEFGLHVVGGCCGTDHEHIVALANATA